MSLRVFIHIEAQYEITHAAAYLNDKRTNYGFLFVDAIADAVKYISSYPESMQAKFQGLRELYIRQFNYVVVYEIRAEELHIYHVIHTSRDLPKRYKRKK